MNNWINWVCVY